MYAGSSNNKSRSSTAGDNSVNELRYQLFCAKKGAGESSQLPPCRDCLFLHTESQLPGCYLGRCLEAKPNVPMPNEHGWSEGDSKLNIL